MKKHKWYCWHCGKPIGKNFVLWSLSDRTDRIFIMCNDPFCLEMLLQGNEIYIIKGKEIKNL
jgi:hypothetical protein